MYSSFAARLNRLFETVYPPGRKPYTSAGGRRPPRQGHPDVGSYLFQLRSGNRDNPSTATVVALADFFGIDPAYFTDDEYFAKLDAELDALARLRGGGETEGVYPYAGRHRAVEPAESDVPVDVGEVGASAPPSESGAAIQSATPFDVYRGRLYVGPEAIASATVNRARKEEERSAPLTADISLAGSPSTAAVGAQGPTVSDQGAIMSGSIVQESSTWKMHEQRIVRPRRVTTRKTAASWSIADGAYFNSSPKCSASRFRVSPTSIPTGMKASSSGSRQYLNTTMCHWSCDIPAGSSDAVLTVERLIAEQPPDMPGCSQELDRWQRLRSDSSAHTQDDNSE